MTFIIAVLILIILSVFSLGLRAYMGFSMLLVGFATTLMGLFGEKVLLILGLCALAYSFFCAYFTVHTSPKGMLRLQILRFYGYGMFLFIKVMLTMLIVFIPLAQIFGQFARSYRDVMIIDCLGREIGRTTVDDRNRGPNGEQFDPPNNIF